MGVSGLLDRELQCVQTAAMEQETQFSTSLQNDPSVCADTLDRHLFELRLKQAQSAPPKILLLREFPTTRKLDYKPNETLEYALRRARSGSGRRGADRRTLHGETKRYIENAFQAKPERADLLALLTYKPWPSA